MSRRKLVITSFNFTLTYNPDIVDDEDLNPAPELLGIDCLAILSFIHVVGFSGVSLDKPDSRGAEVRTYVIQDPAPIV